MKYLFIISFILSTALCVSAQNPPVEFMKGLDLLSIDRNQAKKQFELSLKKDSLFSGTYHFLGVLSVENNEVDSARDYFEKALFLNLDNVNHTREMTFLRFIDTYLQAHEFSEAFNLAHVAYQQYPSNIGILHALQDICLWSFYIRHNELDPSYLSTELKEEYTVNSVAEEYLILRNLLVDGNFLLFKSQQLVKKKRKYYDIVTCELSDHDDLVQVRFKLNWELDKYIGGKVVDTKKVYSNSNLPIYERIGALLVSDADIDILKEIKKLQQED